MKSSRLFMMLSLCSSPKAASSILKGHGENDRGQRLTFDRVKPANPQPPQKRVAADAMHRVTRSVELTRTARPTLSS
jgi:hypothetical protein